MVFRRDCCGNCNLGIMHRQGFGSVRELRAMAALLFSVFALTGCNSVINGWLDPTVVGNFRKNTSLEIRTSLSLEDTPPGIPGESYPTQEDQELVVEDFPISPGDTLAVEIHELRDRGVPYQAQVQISPLGYVNLPVVGRVKAAGLSVSEFEQALIQELKDKDVLMQPEVTINPQFLQRGTYSIFGIGVSAANNAPLRAGVFPIRRPDLRVLEGINQIGGLNEFVTDVYIFREVPRSSSNGDALETDPVVGLEEVTKQPNGTTKNTVINDTANTAPPKPSNIEGGNGPDEQKNELLDLVERRSAETQDEEDEDSEVLKSLQPEPSDPYLWVNNQWIPNPGYKRSKPVEPAEGRVDQAAPSAPTVNWSRIAGESTQRVIRIPAESLRSGDAEMNIFIRAGDVVRIVSGEIGVYYVMGQVNRVGQFSFNAEPVTLKAAIAAAGGLSGLAWPDRCTVSRRVGQREQMIQVNLDRIFGGQDSDFMIRRGDIINVGTHPFAPFLARIRAWTLPTPTNNVGYGFTYARNFADIDSFAVRQNPHNQPDRFPNLFSN
ncbi:MAG: polysaccharide biosynthesis/export family protein [Planctomycetota bacterium]